MPNIQTYNAPPGLTVRPDEQAASVAREAGMVENRFTREGADAQERGTAEIGRSVAQVGSVVQDYFNKAQQHQTFEQVSHGATAYSSLYSNLTQQWNQLAAQADPNDTSIQQGFSEKTLQPALDKFNQAFEGATPDAQKWAQQRSLELQGHFADKMTADMGIRAGAAVQQNIGDMERNYSITAMSDPSSLPHITDSIKTDVAALVASNPNLTPAEAARVQNEMVPKVLKSVGMSAFYGMAQANPDAAKAELSKGTFDQYMTGEEQARASTFADQQKRAKLEDDQRAFNFQKEQAEDTAHVKMDGYITAIKSGDSTALSKAYADPALQRFPELRENIQHFSDGLVNQKFTQQEHAWRAQEHGVMMQNQSNPVGLRDLLTGMRDQYAADPNNISDKPIWDAFKAKQIGYPDLERALTAYKSLDQPLEQSWARQLKTAESGLRTAAGSPGYAMAQSDPTEYANRINQLDANFHQTVALYRKEGKDVTPLVDPNSPSYFLSGKNIGALFGNAKQDIKSQADAARTSAGTIGGAPTVNTGQGLVHGGFKFPNQGALDAYLKAGGK